MLNRLRKAHYLFDRSSVLSRRISPSTFLFSHVQRRRLHRMRNDTFFLFQNSSTTHLSLGIANNMFYASPLFKRHMFIQTQSTPNPDSLKFIPGIDVLGSNKTANFSSVRSALQSPLAKSIFLVEGVKGVFFGPDFITVTKDTNAEWSNMKTLIFAAIMDHFSAGLPLIMDIADSDTAILPEDSETVQMIKEILETRIKPAVQEDGGDIVYKDFRDGVVLLKMQGSCSGCPSSSVTLKSGIERMLMHWIPEVTGVMAVDENDLEKLNLDQFQKAEEKLLVQERITNDHQ